MVLLILTEADVPDHICLEVRLFRAWQQDPEALADPRWV